MVIPQTGSSPDGIKDENVFDIKTGVAISILVKKKSSDTSITYTELWGSRINKYHQCLENSLASIDF